MRFSKSLSKTDHVINDILSQPRFTEEPHGFIGECYASPPVTFSAHTKAKSSDVTTPLNIPD